MNSTEIIKGNKLIDNFMKVSKGNKDLLCLQSLKYNKSWDWLMPVVERCFEKYDLIENNLSNHQFKLNDALIEVNINSLWRTVVEFIKYYNKQKQQ